MITAICMFKAIHYCLLDVFKNFRNKCIRIYKLHSACFLPAPGLALQTCQKNTGVKLELLTNIITLLMVERGITGGICHAMHRYAKASYKYIKNYNENIASSCLVYLDANNLYGWSMCQNLSVNGFEWVEDLSQFNEDFINDYDEKGDEGYFLEVEIQYPKYLFSFHNDL